MSFLNEMNRFVDNPVSVDIPRSIFNLNHTVKFSGNVGDIIPHYVQEVLPGDTFNLETAKVVRTQPLVAPIMDDLYLDTYYFFVPNRLIWEHWKEFLGENNNDSWTPSVEYSIPQLKVPTGGFAVGTIADYLGIPPKMGAGTKISALPFRAYALVCEEWFRDENNMNPVHVTKGDADITGSNGSDYVTDTEKGGKPFIACRIHDYFSSCLPEPQKGPQVQIPIGDYAKVFPSDIKAFQVGDLVPDNVKTLSFLKKVSSTGEFDAPSKGNLRVSDGANLINVGDSTTPATSTGMIPNNLIADLSTATANSVNELRQAFAVQKYYEKLARGGSRYIEYIKSMFGVTSPDYRLQRSEFLGGDRLPLNIADSVQTSSTDATTPQGNVVGFSHTGDVNGDFVKSFTEHGYIIGVSVVRYRNSFQQGVERHFFRKTPFDYYNPVFASLGEMAVRSQEIYFDADPDDVFGYQEAWADYRYKPNRVCGELRSSQQSTLDCWHLGDYYTSQPYLGDSWILCDKGIMDRVVAVPSQHQFYCDFYIKGTMTRVMPAYSIPGLIDHH